jgi:hypothetical protein
LASQESFPAWERSVKIASMLLRNRTSAYWDASAALSALIALPFLTQSCPRRGATPAVQRWQILPKAMSFHLTIRAHATRS